MFDSKESLGVSRPPAILNWRYDQASFNQDGSFSRTQPAMPHLFTHGWRDRFRQAVTIVYETLISC